MANNIEYGLEDIKEVVSYLFGYFKQNDIINNVDQQERFNYWCEINHYMAVDLPFALEQAYMLIENLQKENDILKSQIQFEEENPIFKQAMIYYKTGEHEIITKRNKRYENALKEVKMLAKQRDYLDYGECLDDILNIISQIPKSE